MRGFLGFGRGRAPDEKQRQHRDNALVEKVDEVLSRGVARYDAMRDTERETYYVKPDFVAKLK